VKEFIENAIIYLEKEFVEGKESNAKSLVMNCAYLAASRGHLQNLGSGFGMMFHIAKLFRLCACL
jgi:hypothetical protein